MLVVLGLVALAGVYLYTRLRNREKDTSATRAGRQEPVIRTETAAATIGRPAAQEGEAAKAPSIDHASRIVTIRLMAANGDGIPGDKLILALREAGLRHGKFGIFHRQAAQDEDQSVFSVASLIEPGSFDLKLIKTTRYPGISLFMVLPATADGVSAFDEMVTTARTLAKKLNGDLLDEQGSTLSVQRERYLREEIIQFQHQASTAS